MFARKAMGVLLCGVLLVSTLAVAGCQSTQKVQSGMSAGEVASAKKYELHRVRHFKGGGWMRTVRRPVED